MDNGSAPLDLSIFRTIVDHIDEPIGITDSDRKFVYGNTAVKELLGYESIVGLTITDILAEDETIYLHPQTIQSQQKSHRRAFLRHKNGHSAEFEISGIPFQNGSERFVIYKVNKIEEKFKEELRVSQELYSKLFEYMPDAILIHQEGTIIHANPSAHRLLKSDSDHPLLGTQIIERVHPDFRDIVRERMHGGTVSPCTLIPPLEEKFIALDGTIFYCEVLATSIRIDEKITFLVMIRDVTAEKHYKEELESLNRNLEEQIQDEVQRRREQEQLLIQQSKLASMGEMIGAIAHQWRQPLNALALNIQDLVDAKEFGELDDHYLDNLVGRSMQQINYMSTTIDDFRNYFKSSKAKEHFNLIKALEDVLSILSAQLKHHGITATLTAEMKREAAEVWGYENELKQVLINIINNAKDAIDETGKKEGHIGISVTVAPDSGIMIHISDTGSGITDKVKSRIFDPYFTTKEQGKGTGIGLYMSKTIIEQNMSGRLELIDQPDKTCFAITLPQKSR